MSANSWFARRVGSWSEVQRHFGIGECALFDGCQVRVDALALRSFLAATSGLRPQSAQFIAQARSLVADLASFGARACDLGRRVTAMNPMILHLMLDPNGGNQRGWATPEWPRFSIEGCKQLT